MKQKEFYKGKVWAEEKSRFYETLRTYEQKGKRVLEIGCGAGAGTRFLKELLEPTELYGVDISEDAIAKAKKKGLTAYTINVGDEKLPFKNNFFDLIITFEVVEHVFDTGAFIEEIRRVLKPEGTLYISTPNLAWWMNKALLFFGYQPANTEVDLEHSTLGKPKLFPSGISAGHIHVFTKKSMNEFLSIHTFSVDKTIPIRYENRYTKSVAKNIFLRLFYGCDWLFSSVGGSAFTVFIARKK